MNYENSLSDYLVLEYAEHTIIYGNLLIVPVMFDSIKR